MGLFRKIIRITAEDSPNVQLARAQISGGKQPTGEVIIPGVLPWKEYQKRLKIWDKVRQAIGLHARFWKGAETLLYPPDWLNNSEELARLLDDGNGPIQPKKRQAMAVGIDTAEGGDRSVWTATDMYGVLCQQSMLTPDTDDVIGETIAFGKEWGVPGEMWLFDRGGGGKQHADRLRKMGHYCSCVGFGESIAAAPRHGVLTVKQRQMFQEMRLTYLNRRAQMYGDLRVLLDPYGDGFALPGEYVELRRQLSQIPRMFDSEGRVKLPPKSKPSPKYTGPTLESILGCSPDEADSLVLAVHRMLYSTMKRQAGAVL